jgi:very-short-patch-repair endonuclease
MSTRDEPRVWTKRDRSIVPRQRQLAREMRSAPTQAERKLWWHLRHRLPTRILEATGYRVLRYWNNDVLSNIDGVLEDILSAINDDPGS